MEIEKSDDRISRVALIQKLNAWDSGVHGIPNYAWKVIRELPPVEESSIHIPSGATNGDVIKAVFPDAAVYSYEDSYDLYTSMIICPQYAMMSVDRNWWNAPYREGDTSE